MARPLPPDQMRHLADQGTGVVRGVEAVGGHGDLDHAGCGTLALDRAIGGTVGVRADDQVEVRQVGMVRRARHRIPAGLPDLGQDRGQGLARVQKMDVANGHATGIAGCRRACQRDESTRQTYMLKFNKMADATGCCDHPVPMMSSAMLEISMTDLEIRACSANDLEGLGKVLESIDLFPSNMLPELISPFLGGDSTELWLTCLVDGNPSALCYARAERLTQGTWNMLALGVDAGIQGRGIGTALIAELEKQLRAKDARLVIVETSSTQPFDKTRAFYGRNGYREEATIRDFWSEKDDKIIFRKKLR